MSKLAIKDIKEKLAEERVSQSFLARLREDERKGVQKLLAQYDRKVAKEAVLASQFADMQAFDKQFAQQADSLIAGVDEAGRGPLAGPVVSAAVILPADFSLIGLNDSKQLTAEKRLAYDKVIKEQAISYQIVMIDNKEIDEINIFEATKKSMKEALLQLNPKPSYALIDAVKLGALPFPAAEVIKGDTKSIAIAAASILAKVARDQLMDEIASEYPNYDLASNKGYGTKKHLDALRQYGPSPYHRLTFAPVRQSLQS